MNRVRSMLAVGLLAGGSGCASLHRGASGPPPAPLPPPAKPAAVAGATPGPADPFHTRAAPPSTRISRYFPGLSRPSPTSETARSRRGKAFEVVEDRKSQGTRDQDRDRAPEAAPRPDTEPEGEERATAAMPRRGRWPSRRPVEPPPRQDPETRGASAERDQEPEPRPADRPPLLADSVEAEIDPEIASARPEKAESSPNEPKPERASQLAAVAPARPPIVSPRRTSPLPDLSPSADRSLPPRQAVAARRGSEAERPRPTIREEDRQTRQARVRSDEAEAPVDEQVAAPVDTGPLLAVKAVEDAPGRLRPASPREKTASRAASRPRYEDRPAAEPAAGREASRPRAVERAAVEPVEADPFEDSPPPMDAPPPIEPAATNRAKSDEAPFSEPVVSEDPDTGGDPVLAGRPRLARIPRASANRLDLPPGLPPVAFPRSYYAQTPDRDVPKVDRETMQTSRWTWTAKVFRQLRSK